jgi:parvulin-like peptidyl-prolyl isomerase
LIVLLLAAVLLAGCNNDELPTIVPTAELPPAAETAPPETGLEPGETETGTQVETGPTLAPVTPTPSEPLAALVNGRPIFLADYEKELARFQQAEAALGPSDQNGPEVALQLLIERELISQAAEARGIVVTDEELETMLAELKEEAGSAENFAAWLQTNNLTEEEFLEEAAAGLLTQKMIEIVTADVPFVAEQIHARIIQVDDQTLAQSLVEQIRGGADFAALARQHSINQQTAEIGGDMGFFLPGTLLVPELEAPALALQPDQTSDVIPAIDFDGTQTYYILQVIERDPQRPLEADQRTNLSIQTMEAWIEELRSQAEITIFVDTGT